MDYNTILQRVMNLFATIADMDEEITKESELLEDLGISSMDVLLLLSGIEEEFSIKISEKETRKIYTVGDVADIIAAKVK